MPRPTRAHPIPLVGRSARGLGPSMTLSVPPGARARRLAGTRGAGRSAGRLGWSRRAFLARSLTAAAGVPLILPSRVRGADGAAIAPNNRVTIACIGLGNRGPDNLRGVLSNPEVRVMAVCDVHEGQLAAGRKLVDDHYGDRACAGYRDFRELLARPDLDAVLICTPDHWHPLIAIEAARRGKHLYCEKPLGWSFRAAQAVRKAVLDRGVVFQFGTQQRSDAKFRLACELVRNGRLGRLQTILVGVPGSVACPAVAPEPVPRELDYDLWLGPAPFVPYSFERCRPFTHRPNEPWTRNYSTWYHISDYCLGFIGNWGIHHLDIAQWGHGTTATGPVEVEGTGVFPGEGLADCALSWQVENRFADGVTLIHMDDETAKRHPRQVGGHGHGVTFLGTEGWVHVRRGFIQAHPESLLETKWTAGEVRLPASEHHLGNFVDAVKGRCRPIAPIDEAVRSDTLCHLAQIAIQTRRRLRWDPDREAFVGDDAAQRRLDRPMRSPWRL
jgi:predicted dehydrogenase